MNFAPKLCAVWFFFIYVRVNFLDSFFGFSAAVYTFNYLQFCILHLRAFLISLFMDFSDTSFIDELIKSRMLIGHSLLYDRQFCSRPTFSAAQYASSMCSSLDVDGLRNIELYVSGYTYPINSEQTDWIDWKLTLELDVKCHQERHYAWPAVSQLLLK